LKKIIFLFFVTLSISSAEDYNQYMTCHDIIKEIETLHKLKKASEQHNIEDVERLLVAATGNFYFGNRRFDPRKINIDKRVAELETKLKDCSPY